MEGCGWEPYPLSLRICKFNQKVLKNQAIIPNEWLNNLQIQIEALSRQLNIIC